MSDAITIRSLIPKSLTEITPKTLHKYRFLYGVLTEELRLSNEAIARKSKSFAKVFPELVANQNAASIAQNQWETMKTDTDVYTSAVQKADFMKALFREYVKRQHPDITGGDGKTIQDVQQMRDSNNLLGLIDLVEGAVDVDDIIEDVGLTRYDKQSIVDTLNGLVKEIEFLKSSIIWKYYFGSDDEREAVCRFVESLQTSV